MECSSVDSNSDSDSEVKVTQIVTRSSVDAPATAPVVSNKVNPAGRGPAASEVSKNAATATAAASSSLSFSQNNTNDIRRRQRCIPSKMPSREEILEKIEMKKRIRRLTRRKKRAEMSEEQKAAVKLKDKLRARERRRRLQEECIEVIEEMRKNERERQARKRAAMTPEEKDALRVGSRLYRRLERRRATGSTKTKLPGVRLREQFKNEVCIMNQIRNRVRAALETPLEREKRLAIKNRRGRRTPTYAESVEERELREILVRKAFAVEIGKEEEMRQFEMRKEQELRLELEMISNGIEKYIKPAKNSNKLPYGSKISETDGQILEYWGNQEKNIKVDDIFSYGDGIIASDDDDDQNSGDDEIESQDKRISKDGAEETEAEWSARVSDIFKTRTQDKSQETIPQDKITESSPSSAEEPQVKDVTVKAPPAPPKVPDDTEFLKSTLSRKDYLINIISVEKAERVLIVEAEIAERQAALAGETEEERKARIEFMLEEVKRTNKSATIARRRRKKNPEGESGNIANAESTDVAAAAASTAAEKTPGSGGRRKRKEMTEEEKIALKKRNAEYMRQLCDLYKVEWETWVGLRDASAPPGLCQIPSEVTGVVNAEGALNWLEENKEDHRWGINKGAAVKMGRKVPEAVKKYRLSLATIIDTDEKRSGPNAKRVARETLLQLLTTERKILEEYFYGRRTYIQKMSTNWMNKTVHDPEQIAERIARLNERLRQRYKEKRLKEGKTYDPDRFQGKTRKDKEALLKELTGKIPKSTRGVTKTRWANRGKLATPVVRDGRTLNISRIGCNKPPGERVFKKTVGDSARIPVGITSNELNSSLNTKTTDQHVIPTLTCCETLTTRVPLVPQQPTLVSVSALQDTYPTAQPRKRNLRSSRRNKEETPSPSPPPEPEERDSDSDWAPADVDESLFDDDDSREAGASVENSTTPPARQETWNPPPTLEPFSTLNQNHLFFQSLHSHNSYSAAPAFSSSTGVGHGGMFLGNHPPPAFPTAWQSHQHNSTHFQQQTASVPKEVPIPVLSSSQEYTPSYAPSECSVECGPPSLSPEEESNSIPDMPPQKRRRGRPPSSSSSNTQKMAKRITNRIHASHRKSKTKPGKVTLDTSLLRPGPNFSEGKVPTVSFPFLLIDPTQKNNPVNAEAESTLAAPEAPNESPDAQVVVSDTPVDTSCTQNNTMKCLECSETFKNDEKLDSHKSEKHSTLETNLDVSSSEKKVDLKSVDEETLKSRKKDKTQKIEFKCPLCDAVIRDTKGGSVFTNHLWTTHWKDELNSDLGPCPICQRTLKGQGARYYFYITRHIDRYHADIKKTIFIPGLQKANKIENYSPEKFYCIVCSATFPSYLPLARHLEYGHSRACQVCGIVLQVQDHLKDHMQIFHPQETYIPQAILSEEKLKVIVHCARCHSKFIDSDHLKSHEEVCERTEKDKISTHKCWWRCAESRSYKSLEALEDHHKEHHEQDTIVPEEGYENLHHLYKCEVCPRRCSSLPILRLHYLKSHPSAPPIPEVDYMEPEMELNLRPQLHIEESAPKTRIRNTAKADEFPELKRASGSNKKAISALERLSYSCGECFKGFSATQFCLLHRGYTKARKRCCRTCGAQYANLESLIGHNRTKHGISAEENSRLEKEYEEQRLQLAMDMQEPLLKCGVCFKKFVAKDFHIMHSTMGDVLDPTQQTCPHCPDLTFCHKRELTKHMDLCHSDPETAAETAKRIEDEKRRAKVKRTTKAKQTSGSKLSDEQQEWSCDHCGSVFTLRGSLQRHIKNMHSGMEKRFQCPHCEHKSPRLETLRSHIKAIHQSQSGRTYTPRPPRKPRVHIPDKQCPQCVKKFATERALQIHIEKTHVTGTLCYACGDTVKDIKAHNEVCPMGGMDEDALIKDKSSNIPKPIYHKVRKIAKLPLLSLLHLVRQHQGQLDESATAEKRGRKKKCTKAETTVSDEDEENESAVAKCESEPRTKRESRKKKSSSELEKKSKGKGKDEDSKSHKRKHKKHKRSKKVKSEKVEKSERRGRKKKKDFDDDENNSDDEDDRNLEDDNRIDKEDEETEIKEEIDDVTHDDEFCFDVQLDDEFGIQPEEEVSCAVEDCPCEKDKWKEIIHGDKVVAVPLVRCDPEVEAIQERRGQVEAENERKKKEAEEKLEREMKEAEEERIRQMKLENEEKKRKAKVAKAQKGRRKSKVQTVAEKRRKRREYDRERRQRRKIEVESQQVNSRKGSRDLAEVELERKRKRAEYGRERHRKRQLAAQSQKTARKGTDPADLTEVEVERRRRRAEYYRQRRLKLKMQKVNAVQTFGYPVDQHYVNESVYEDNQHYLSQIGSPHRSSTSPDPTSVEGWTQLNHIILSNGDAVDMDSSSDEDISQDPLAL